MEIIRMSANARQAALALVAALAIGHVSAADMNMRVFQINDHLISFYVGRLGEAAPLSHPELGRR